MIDMLKGTIVKIISNQYTIYAQGEFYDAKPRGKMRLKQAPVVGDIVSFEQIEDSYRIHEIQKRRNYLLRPTIANVDQALIVTSLVDPDFSEHLLNRLIFLVSLADIEPIICITKADLCQDIDTIRSILSDYEKAGYTVVYSHPESDDAHLKSILQGKISVLCGQSGAGKSSLLNRLDPSFQLKTQAISKALGRGKHTTRYCHLHQICDGWVADTPGFSSLDFSRFDLSNFDEKIKDFRPYLHQCKFSDCQHINEPDCVIKEAVAQGQIHASIYEDYKQIIETQKGK